MSNPGASDTKDKGNKCHTGFSSSHYVRRRAQTYFISFHRSFHTFFFSCLGTNHWFLCTVSSVFHFNPMTWRTVALKMVGLKSAEADWGSMMPNIWLVCVSDGFHRVKCLLACDWNPMCRLWTSTGNDKPNI